MKARAAKRAEVEARSRPNPAPVESTPRPVEGRAERVIRFIEQLIVPSGTGQGRPFVMRDWQKKFIIAVYDPVDPATRFRRIRRAILSMGRKNGKTALIAALVLCHLVGPEAIMNGEIYSAANDREQAAQVYKVCAQIVRADPELSALLKCTDSTKNIACYATNSFYRAISAEAGTKHGLNPSMVIYDELAQSKDTELYDVLDTSMGARDEPLFIVISTQSNDKQHILSRLIDDGLYSNDPTIVCHLYAVPEDVEDIFDPSCWALGNPALGDFLKFADLEAQAAAAKRMPSKEPAFRNLRLNQRVAPEAAMISRVEWMACIGDATWKPGEKIALGLDLSSTNDLSALVGVSMEDKSRVQGWYWKPKDLLEEHTKRDFSGTLGYVDWEKQGHLLTTHGKSIDKMAIALHIAKLFGDFEIVGLAFDRWRMHELMKEFENIQFETYRKNISDEEEEYIPQPGLRLVDWGQGFKDLSPAIEAFEKEVTDRTLIHASNPVLNWNMRNAISVMDPAGNRKIDKSKTRFRIDGAVALTMALGLKAKMRKTKEADYEIHFL